MELKRDIASIISCGDTLLIVPYGIETRITGKPCDNWRLLLIVPYGIETLNQSARFRYLGTFNRTLWNWNIILLIWYMMTLTFNRTLWNWNSLPAQCLNNPFSFNRTLWNWNFCRGRLACGKTRLLIVPYGIETKKTTLFQLCFTCF